MPFTPSHAVVALPFVKTPLVPAAIAVGAMTPDLPLFLRGTPITYLGTHDLRWIAGTMALALGMLLVWRCVLRPAARELSPRWLAERLPAGWDDGAARGWAETFTSSWRSVVVLIASLAIGVASHIAWDAFTHEGRVGVALLPALDEQWGPLLGFKWVQHGSSAIGLVILAIAGWAWFRRQTPGPVDRALPAIVRIVAWASLPFALAAGWLTGLALYGPLTNDFTYAHLAYRVLPPTCAIWAVLVVTLCLVIQARRALMRVSRTRLHG
jgi:hypothetical protein